ncbi:MAG: integrase [Ramlibacter sp.]|nr:integrase [Ramlibacter sp.]
MRGTGKPDVRLGRDFDAAVRQWDHIHNKAPRIAGTLQEAFNRWRERELPQYASAVTRRCYAQNLTRLEPVFGRMAWDELTLPMLREYLDRRTAKTQGNREVSLLCLVWGKAKLWGMHALAWPAAGVKNWKNEEQARSFDVTDEIFTAVYAQADQVLRDCMDIATATGMRLTDVRTATVPVGGILQFRANKTGKAAQFEIAASPVLSAVAERRAARKVGTVLFLTTSTGKTVTAQMLRKRWDEAREKAAAKAQDGGNKPLADAIRSMYLRDTRKRAADLAGNAGEAAELLQHSSKRLTEQHYRTKASKLRAVR